MMDNLTDKASTLTGLYKGQTLYKADDNSPSLSYQGGNAKHILLAYNNPDLTSESRLEKEILNRMFSRLNTSFNDIALVNKASNASLSYTQIYKELSPKVFVSFGLLPDVFNLNIEVKLYQTITMGNSRLLFCDDLLTIDKNNEIKKKFWSQFSPLFL